MLAVLEGRDIGSDGAYAFVGFEHLRHDAHLRTVDVALVATANPGLEILELPDDIPAMLIGQARCIECLRALTELTVTGKGLVSGL